MNATNGKLKKNKWIGKLPVNSRITIDYSGQKPKVKFGYPKKNVREQTGSDLSFMISFGITVITFFILMVIGSTIQKPVFQGCDVYAVNGYISELNATSYPVEYRMDCLFDGERYNTTLKPLEVNPILNIDLPYWHAPYRRLSVDIPVRESLIGGTWLILFIIEWYVLYKIIALIFAHTHWGHKTFPEWNKKLHNAHWSATFKPSDVKNKIVELPLFKNFFMDFEATGEMSKYLKRVEIREHPFARLSKKKGKVVKKKNISLWKATFFFSKKPQGGGLEIRWT